MDLYGFVLICVDISLMPIEPLPYMMESNEVIKSGAILTWVRIPGVQQHGGGVKRYNSEACMHIKVFYM